MRIATYVNLVPEQRADMINGFRELWPDEDLHLMRNSAITIDATRSMATRANHTPHTVPGIGPTRLGTPMQRPHTLHQVDTRFSDRFPDHIRTLRLAAALPVLVTSRTSASQLLIRQSSLEEIERCRSHARSDMEAVNQEVKDLEVVTITRQNRLDLDEQHARLMEVRYNANRNVVLLDEWRREMEQMYAIDTGRQQQAIPNPHQVPVQ